MADRKILLIGCVAAIALLAAGGVFFSVLLGAALMGLVFLSSGTGHDEQIQDFSEDDDDRTA